MSGLFSFQRHPSLGSNREWSAGGVVGGVLRQYFPSYNSVVMTETILHSPSRLDGLLERLPKELDLRGEEFERADKRLKSY